MKNRIIGIPKAGKPILLIGNRRRNLAFIQAHEASGHVTMREHVSKQENAVNKVIQADERFNKPPTNISNYGYTPKPFCVDCTTPDEKGIQHAIIHTSDNRLVRHPFEYDETACVAKMCEGEPKPTESTRVYAHRVEQFEGMIKARNEEIISCRVTAGAQIDASEKWEAGKPVKFIYVPGGDHTITAGFRKGETITCTIRVNEDTAKALQESFDFLTATEEQEPYGDEDHEGKKATLRFPAGKVKFSWGTLRGKEGVICEGGEPTSYGADCANGKIYTSWSGEFASDLAKDKLVCKKKHNSIPDGERGSKSNPAEITDVNFVVGAMTNQPAFHKMPKITAKDAEAEKAENEAEAERAIITAAGTSEGVRKSWETRQKKTNDAFDAGTEAVKAAHKAHSSEEKKDHMAAAEAFEKAASLHKSAAEERKGNDTAHDKFMRESHESAAKNFLSQAGYHRDQLDETTKATDKTGDSRNSETPENQVATIFASNAAQRAEVDAILTEAIPNIKHRKALESIFSQSGS